jgi:hypothetical protein
VHSSVLIRLSFTSNLGPSGDRLTLKYGCFRAALWAISSRRFVSPQENAPSTWRNGASTRPSNFWVIWDAARRRAGLTWVRFHDLRHFAATMFASTGASTKEIMSRRESKSVAMVVRYEHAPEERNALLAQPLNLHAEGSKLVQIASKSEGDRASRAHYVAGADKSERELLELSLATQKCSGGEIRTHNLAGAPDEDPEQH